MSTINSKNDIFKLMKTLEFQTAIGLNTREEYLEQSPKFPNELFEYFSNKWKEEGQGVKLFSTPKRGNNCGDCYGTWLTVSKLYGNPDLPFRVQAAEYVPWGVDIDLADVGDYRTLGESLDVAFIMHEVGRIELNVIGENESTGRYTKADSIISWSTASGLSPQAMRVNQILKIITERLHTDAAERKMRYAEPVNIADVSKLLPDIQAMMNTRKVEDDTSVRLHLAAAIKEHMFAGRGELIQVVNNDLQHHPVEIDSTTLLLVRQGDDVAYIDGNGVYSSKEEANVSIANAFTEIYEPQITENPDGKAHSVCWFDEIPWEVYLDENTFLPVADEPKLMMGDPLNPYPSGEEEVNKIVDRVANAYKMSRERRYQQSLAQASELTPG